MSKKLLSYARKLISVNEEEGHPLMVSFNFKSHPKDLEMLVNVIKEEPKFKMVAKNVIRSNLKNFYSQNKINLAPTKVEIDELNAESKRLLE